MSAHLENTNAGETVPAAGEAGRLGEVRAGYGLPVIEPDPEAPYAPFPLTEIQQAYWVGRGAGFRLGNIAAHGYMEVEARQVDVARLEAAFNTLIVRHPMLRAVIDGDGRQRVLKETPPYRFGARDLAETDEADRRERLAALRAEMSHQVLDPAVWPLFEVRVTRLPEGVCRLHLSFDVLIFDALSFDILSREWAALYRGDPLPPPPRCTYADYVRGLERLRETPLYEQSRNYWRARLEALPPAPELPLARAPETIERPRFERRTGRLGPAAWDAVKNRARAAGVTPSVILLALFGEVLARWSARPRFTLNLTLFNRLPFHPDIDRVVGDFTSVIPIALDFEAPAPFADRARGVQERLWQDLDHGYVSGVSVIRELTELRRDASAGQLPVVFTSAIDPDPAKAGEPAAMRWLGEPRHTITQTPQVWLDHQITEDAGALVYDWDFIAELFPAGMIDDLFGVYGERLAALAADAAAWRAGEPDLLPGWQRDLQAAANATAAEVPAGLLHEPVLARCAATPEAPALIGGGETVSYGELRRRANQLAAALWRAGLGSGDRVAVLLPKGVRQAIAVLGILEAGGVYVPIEADTAPERIAQTLRLAGAGFAVTLRALAEATLSGTATTPLCLDELEPQAHGLNPLPAMRNPEEPAYIIYTSGSTGIPKGVVIDHRGALNTVVDINRRFGVTARDRVLALSALNFDLSVYDIFGLLAAGGAVVFPDADRQREPAHWRELIEEHGVTLWNTVPALMDIYVAYLREAAGRTDEQLRRVMLSGDWIPVPLPDAIRRQCPRAELSSLGGATEASIWSILYPIGAVDPAWPSIPYGRAMDNQTFHVLDAALRPCPVWVPGELYIGGIGLAHGYWRDPERTAAAFIRHPRGGERLYRTGDLGRWLPDGNIEFLGRRDFQVKINGYRVELGEVEAHLLQFPGVQAAVAAVRGERDKARRLVGFYVREGGRKRREDSAKLRLRWSEPALRRFGADVPRTALAPESACALPWRNPSCRHYATAPLPLARLADWLACLRHYPAEAGRPRYHYGSAGGLYPVQAYLFVKPGRVRDLAEGVYYYSPAEHALVRLAEGDHLELGLFASQTAAVIEAAAVYLLLAVDLGAIEPLYGADSFNLALLEAGLMTQLLEQSAPLAGLGLCQIGGLDFDRARPLLGGEAKLRFLHGLVAGTPGPVPEAAVPPAVPKEDPAREEERFAAELRAHLRARLPAYMVPSSLVRLDDLPLSANGKVDRAALARIEAPRTESGPPESPAADPRLAGTIAEVWREVLGLERVGLDDNIFDLGGTSVHMIKIHALLQPRLPREVSLIDMFFTHATIGALVRQVAPASDEAAGDSEAGPRRRERGAGLAGQRDRRQRARDGAGRS